MRIETDARAIDGVEPDPEGERRVRELAAQFLDTRIRLARALRRIEVRRTYALSACSSAVQFAQRFQITAAEARALLDLGRALEAEPPAAADEPGAEPPPSVEARLRSGRLGLENAQILVRLLRRPGNVEPGEDWIARAESMPTAELRRRVDQRIEERAQGETDLLPIAAHVTRHTREQFRRVRVLASREAGFALTDGQVLTLLVREYLDAHDERRRGAHLRRVGPTPERRGERRVPAAVRRGVLDRSGDRCEVPGCTHATFLEFAHVVAHRDGGGCEERNLLRLCHAHHVQFDAGVLRLLGWRDDRPVFGDVHGAEIRAAAEAGADVERPYVIPPDDDGTGAAVQVSERPPPRWGVVDDETVGALAG